MTTMHSPGKEWMLIAKQNKPRRKQRKTTVAQRKRAEKARTFFLENGQDFELTLQQPFCPSEGEIQNRFWLNTVLQTVYALPAGKRRRDCRMRRCRREQMATRNICHYHHQLEKNTGFRYGAADLTCARVRCTEPHYKQGVCELHLPDQQRLEHNAAKLFLYVTGETDVYDPI